MLFVLALIPITAGFQDNTVPSLSISIYLSIIYFLDICIRLLTVTTLPEDRDGVKRAIAPSTSMTSKIKTLRFELDFLSTIPWDILFAKIYPGWSAARSLIIIRLLMLHRLAPILTNQCTFIRVSLRN